MIQILHFFAACVSISGAHPAPGHALQAAAAQASGGLPVVTPLKSGAVYAKGETVGWRVSYPPSETAPTLPYRILKNDSAELQSGEIKPGAESTIQVKLDEPAMVMLRIGPDDRSHQSRYGAAYDPTALKPVEPRPSDFHAFWHRKLAELATVPPEPVVTLVDLGRQDVVYSKVQLNHVNGTHIYGQLARPATPGKYPAMLVLQWASPPYPLDRSWVVGPAAQGWLVLNIEPHDVPVDAPSEFYRSLPDSLKHYERVGMGDRDRSYFVEMYLRGYRAVEYLATQPDWDGKTILVTGGSMGGQQSLCVAGLNSRVSDVIVEEPAGCDLAAALHSRAEGYPFLPVHDAAAMHTAAYVDAVNFAPDIHAACLVSMGFKDDVAPPAGIWTAFNLIKGPKECAPMPDAPHNNSATREQQMPYYVRQDAWLKAIRAGRKVPPRE